MAKTKISITSLRRDLVRLWDTGPNGERCSPWTKSVAKDAYDVIGRLQRDLRKARAGSERKD